jgi:hypothetical protein
MHDARSIYKIYQQWTTGIWNKIKHNCFYNSTHAKMKYLDKLPMNCNWNKCYNDILENILARNEEGSQKNDRKPLFLRHIFSFFFCLGKARSPAFNFCLNNGLNVHLIKYIKIGIAHISFFHKNFPRKKMLLFVNTKRKITFH